MQQLLTASTQTPAVAEGEKVAAAFLPLYQLRRKKKKRTLKKKIMMMNPPHLVRMEEMMMMMMKMVLRCFLARPHPRLLTVSHEKH